MKTKTIIIRQGDPRKEEIRETIRNDIVENPAIELDPPTRIKVKDLKMISKLAKKNYKNLTEEEQKDYLINNCSEIRNKLLELIKR
jgi:hypothetical protein